MRDVFLMIGEIGLVTILTDNVRVFADFYSRILGFEKPYESENYVEFKSEGVRFAVCARSVLYRMTNHASYGESRKGQSFELAFPVTSSEDVDCAYHEIVEKGAIPIQALHDTPWRRRTALFADPDGNIHELYGPEEE